MVCLRCKQASEFVFCSNCTPTWGEVVKIDKACIFVGEFSFTQAVKAFFSGKRVIKWWCGSDLLTMLKFPPGRGRLSILRHRLKMRLLEPLISQHWCNGTGLLRSILDLDYISTNKPSLQLWIGKDLICPKVKHDGFNVVYYAPSDSVYGRWVYGLDVIAALILMFPAFNWIKLNGKNDLKEIWPTADVYLRPSRWDGYPRLVREARLNNIPVIYSENFDLTAQACAAQLRAIFSRHQLQTDPLPH